MGTGVQSNTGAGGTMKEKINKTEEEDSRYGIMAARVDETRVTIYLIRKGRLPEKRKSCRRGG